MGKKEPKEKKPFYKKVWFWVVAVIIVAALIKGPSDRNGTNNSNNNNNNNTTVADNNKETKPQQTETQAPTTKATEPETTTVVETTEDENANVPTKYTLTAGTYVAGIDIPAGRFEITPISGTGNIMSSDYDGLNGLNSMITDGQYVSLFASSTITKGAILYVSQSASIELNYTKVTSGCTGREKIESAPITLKSGEYVSGVDFEPGIYNAKIVSGTGNLITDLDEGYANEMWGADNGWGTSFTNLMLPKDTNLTITMDLIIELTKIAE